MANREPRAPLTAPESLNLGLALSPDRSMLATTSGSQVVLWDLRSNTQRRLQASYLVSTNTPRSPRPIFNADGSKLAAVTQNGPIRVWDSKSGDQLLEACYLRGTPRPLGYYSWDGESLLTMSSEEGVRVWQTDGELEILRGHTSYVYPVAVSQDGAMIASGSWDHSVRLWDARTSEPIAVLRGHSGPVVDLAFQPNSHFLASASFDGSVLIRDIRTGSLLRRLDFGQKVKALEFTPDGTRLLICDGGISIFD